MKVGRTLLSSALVVAAVWPTVASQSADAKDVLDRTTRYVRMFVLAFANVVAEERYVQTANPNNPGAGRPRRVLLSDFQLVAGQASNDWYQFRDVREVDGKPVRDRERRLTELFLEPWDAAIRQARRIANDSARWREREQREVDGADVHQVVRYDGSRDLRPIPILSGANGRNHPAVRVVRDRAILG